MKKLYYLSASLFLIVIFPCIVVSADYCPLDLPRTLVYAHFETTSGKNVSHDKKEITITQKWLSPRIIKNVKVTPIQFANGNLMFVGENQSGIVMYGSQSVESVEPRINIDSNRYILKYPIKVKAAYQNHDNFYAEIFGTYSHIGLDFDTTIESNNESVIVLSGEYQNCLKIRTTKTQLYDDEKPPVTLMLEEYKWFAENIGMVKSIREETFEQGDIRKQYKSTVLLKEVSIYKQ